MENKPRSRYRLPTLIAGAVLAVTTSLSAAWGWYAYRRTYDITERLDYSDGTSQEIRSLSRMDSLLNWTIISIFDTGHLEIQRHSPFQTVLMWDYEGDGLVDELGALPYSHEEDGYVLKVHLFYSRDEHYATMKDLFDKKDKELREQITRFGLEDALKQR